MAEMDRSKLAILLDHIAPGTRLEAMDTLSLGFSNRSFRMRGTGSDGSQVHYVVKQYSYGSDHIYGQSADARAHLEYRTLTLLRDGGIPCPEPIFFDPQGAILGAPVLITKGIPGEQILAHPANPLWAAKAVTIAEWLARIHTLSCPAELRAILPDATSRATGFLDNDTIPDYMQAYPDGEMIWYTVRQELPNMAPVDPVLVHGDYWSGNVLWENGQLTGILDWEDVSFGEPGFDVAYCRMEMIIDGMYDAADTFLSTYETCTGKPVVNLALCELAMAVTSMRERAPYLAISPIKERYRQFVADAKKRL
jgi:aminoglycoside phosphotransferase (APT) family kinase protein